jgi:hypothetical protein
MRISEFEKRVKRPQIPHLFLGEFEGGRIEVFYGKNLSLIRDLNPFPPRHLTRRSHLC